MTPTDTLGYYRARADQAMRRAGARDYDTTQIAQWAAQHHRQFRYGILVDAAGTIVAQTVRQDFDPQADYIDHLLIDDTPAGVDVMEADMARAVLSRHLGRPPDPPACQPADHRTWPRLTRRTPPGQQTPT